MIILVFMVKNGRKNIFFQKVKNILIIYLPSQDKPNVEEYYHFDFLSNFNSIEVDIFYDILNSLNDKELLNLNNYIFKQWSLTRLNLTFKEIVPCKRKKELLKINYILILKVFFKKNLKKF